MKEESRRKKGWRSERSTWKRRMTGRKREEVEWVKEEEE